jgi:hypothetical protein
LAGGLIGLLCCFGLGLALTVMTWRLAHSVVKVCAWRHLLLLAFHIYLLIFRSIIFLFFMRFFLA